MSTTRINIADLAEPEDGAVVIVRNGDDYRVIVRSDADAETGEFADERWFNAGDYGDIPLSWEASLKYANAVYALGELLAGVDD